jgi:DNA-binding transcriptional LysR family regulator
MDWGKLQTFIALARAGNLTRAALALDVHPTTVSRTIRNFERDLGRTLFEHSRDGQVLTTAGRALLASAEAMARAAEGLEHHAEDPGEGGLLRVSVSEGFGVWFVSPRIGAFAARLPGMQIDLVANSGFLNPSRKEADIAILLARPRKGPLKTRKLTDYALGVYRAVNAEASCLVGYIPDFIYAPELNYLSEAGFGREAAIRSSSITAQQQMIAAGAGVGILPCFMGDADARLVRVQPELTIRRTFWLAVHQDVSALPRVRGFVDWLVEACRHDRAVLMGEGVSPL